MKKNHICHSCRSNSGKKRISPGETIFSGRYWQVEHAYPSGLEGWLVIVLKRHCEQLHLLKEGEWRELGILQQRSCKALRKVMRSSKEYIMCFAEGQGFKHIHFHVVPKHAGFDEKHKGSKVFDYLKMPKKHWIPEKKVAHICAKLKNSF